MLPTTYDTGRRAAQGAATPPLSGERPYCDRLIWCWRRWSMTRQIEGDDDVGARS